MSEFLDKKTKLKELLKKLGNDEKTESIKNEFSEFIRELTPLEISQAEQELIDEGISVEDIQLMCDIHLDVFKKAIDDDEIVVEAWHPLNILIEEHKDMLNMFHEMKKNADKPEEALNMGLFLSYLKKIDSYFHKEENVLFPVLEKKGLIQPPKIMWEEHDRLRQLRKETADIYEKGNFEGLSQKVLEINEILVNHVYKEHKVLFPSALKLIDEDEWREMRVEFDEIGYFAYFPKPFVLSNQKIVDFKEGFVNLPSGMLTPEQLILMLNNLPVDITFVDENDVVRYFSETKDRIFVRSRSIVGRKVQNCHPPKSLHIVEKILRDFKEGIRDEADFHIQMGDKLIYIRYFALKDGSGKYTGTLEITQDIAPLKKIDGEKRIYDER